MSSTSKQNETTEHTWGWFEYHLRCSTSRLPLDTFNNSRQYWGMFTELLPQQHSWTLILKMSVILLIDKHNCFVFIRQCTTKYQLQFIQTLFNTILFLLQCRWATAKKILGSRIFLQDSTNCEIPKVNHNDQLICRKHSTCNALLCYLLIPLLPCI